MKTYGGVYVKVHVLLTAALFGGEWSASHPCRLTPGERPPCPLHRRLGGPKAGPRRREDEKYLAPTGTRTPIPLSSSQYPVAIPTTLSWLYSVE
jgi:hypothetical protein